LAIVSQKIRTLYYTGGEMIITIVFDYPDVDPDSEEASEIFDTLYDDLEEFGYETGNIWYLED
jgi:hypothetical protein